MRISEIRTKAGEAIQLGHLTVLVGPNNVGKSQTLRDIHGKMLGGPAATGILLEELLVPKPASLAEALAGLEVRDHPNQADTVIVRGISSNLTSGEQVGLNPEQVTQQLENAADASFLLRTIGRFRVSFLDAGSRLQVAQSTPSIDAHEQTPERLLQDLYLRGEEVEEALRNAFRKTFRMDIKLDYSALTTLSLRVARLFAEVPKDPRAARPVMSRYDKLDTQGDGFRSFVGVVLSLLLSRGRIILLDEPEAFLHPAQARLLGAWVAGQARMGNNQLLVATHNGHFLRGILDSGEDVDIFRLNRTDNDTSYVHIPSDTVAELSHSPLLSSQPVLDAVFHKGVVVTEGDSDRSLYHLVAVREVGSREILFVHAQSKQTVKDVVGLLRSAGIPVCAAVDFDILNSESEFEALLTSVADVDTGKYIEIRNEVAETVEQHPDAVLLKRLQEDVEEFLGQLHDGDHTLSGARRALRRIDASASRWRELKRRGLAVLEGDLQQKTADCLRELKTLGLFVVPNGALESWIELGTSKKKGWIVKALPAIHDGEAPEDLVQFVRDMIEYLGEEPLGEEESRAGA